MIKNIVLLLLLVGLAFAQNAPEPFYESIQKLSVKPEFTNMSLHSVISVIDGDTFVAKSGDKESTIRLLGVDTSETKDSNQTIQHYGPEATTFLSNLLQGESVYLVTDPNQSKTDKYNLSLAYVYRAPDGLFVNAEIIRQGYGKSYREYPCKYTEDFNKLEAFAKANQKGMWNENNKRIEFEILSYDGIPLGTNQSEVKKYLIHIKGIERDFNNVPILTKIQEDEIQSVYQYKVNRSINGKEGPSDVALFFKNNQLIHVETFYLLKVMSSQQDISDRYNNIAYELINIWGQPEYKTIEETKWTRKNAKAILRLEMPSDSYSLPIIILLIWSQN